MYRKWIVGKFRVEVYVVYLFSWKMCVWEWSFCILVCMVLVFFWNLEEVIVSVMVMLNNYEVSDSLLIFRSSINYKFYDSFECFIFWKIFFSWFFLRGSWFKLLINVMGIFWLIYKVKEEKVINKKIYYVFFELVLMVK